MKRRLLAVLGILLTLVLLSTALSLLIYGRFPTATVYEWLLRRRFATDRTPEEEIERLKKRREKAEPEAELPESLTFRTPVQSKRFHGMKVFALNWEAGDATVLYLHGGAYINSFNPYQWRFMDTLAAEAHCRVLAPAYHLAPWADHRRAYDDLTVLWRALMDSDPGRVILMGDSAGGGLALGLAQALAAAGDPLPEQLILLSPWVDVSMDNPDILPLQSVDPILHLALVKVHGRVWAAGADTHDPRVSPLYGDMTGLPPVTLFTGTRELLYPDILKVSEKLRAAGVQTRLVVGRGLNHDYPLMPLPEARAAVGEIVRMAS